MLINECGGERRRVVSLDVQESMWRGSGVKPEGFNAFGDSECRLLAGFINSGSHLDW